MIIYGLAVFHLLQWLPICCSWMWI